MNPMDPKYDFPSPDSDSNASSIARDEPIADSDSRAIIRLLGEVILCDGDHTAKKRYLMNGLCRLIDAADWAWTQLSYEPGAKEPYWVNVNYGGFSEAGFVALTRALGQPECTALHHGFLNRVAEPGSQITATRSEFDPTNRVRFEDPEGSWCHAGVSDLIASYRRIRPGLLTSSGLYRRPGTPRFTRREVRIVDIVMDEVPWLHEEGWPDNSLEVRSMPELSRSERLALRGLLDGLPPSAIAEAMRISPHTLNGYTKAVYRHFGVNSRAQLLSRFLRTERGERA